MTTGDLIAVGRTSRVVDHGPGRVAKILNEGVPNHWAEVEAAFTEVVRQLSLPAPEVLEVIEIGGRPAIVFERIAGPTMWQEMQSQPERVSELVTQFVMVQRQIHSAGVPWKIPSLIERMGRKIADVESLPEAELSRAADLLGQTPRGAALLHGDFHPGNVLVNGDDLVVIDWFDASIGHPVADVVRTAMLLQADGATDLRHLPDADPVMVRSIYEQYIDEMDDTVSGDRAALARWERMIAVSRLAERTDHDESGLQSIWRSEFGGQLSAALTR